MELVAGMRARNEQAWRCFLADYGRLVYSVAARFDLSRTETEDHFQSVCFAALRGIDALRDPERLASWTYNIAYRLAIDMLRRQRTQKAVVPLADSDSPALRLEPTVLADLQRLEETARLYDAMARLDGRCRRLITALFLEDPPPGYTEISSREKLPVGSIGPTRARCLRKMQKFVAELSSDPSPASNGSEAPAGRPPQGDPHEGRETQ